MEIFDPEFHTAMALHMDMTIARSREVTPERPAGTPF